MTRLGMTGHQRIPEEAREFVRRGLKSEIQGAARARPLWGLVSLAVGADQMFADLILEAGGSLHVIVPSVGYEKTFDAQGLATYRRLLAGAAKVDLLKFDEPTEEAFFAAGRRVVDLCERLLAVWDGKPSGGLGGTADVVKYAQASGRNVTIVWPVGVTR